MRAAIPLVAVFVVLACVPSSQASLIITSAFREASVSGSLTNIPGVSDQGESISRSKIGTGTFSFDEEINLDVSNQDGFVGIGGFVIHESTVRNGLISARLHAEASSGADHSWSQGGGEMLTSTRLTVDFEITKAQSFLLRSDSQGDSNGYLERANTFILRKHDGTFVYQLPGDEPYGEFDGVGGFEFEDYIHLDIGSYTLIAEASALIDTPEDIGFEGTYAIQRFQLSAVPEPGSICLMIIGSGLFLLCRRRVAPTFGEGAESPNLMG